MLRASVTTDALLELTRGWHVVNWPRTGRLAPVRVMLTQACHLAWVPVVSGGNTQVREFGVGAALGTFHAPQNPRRSSRAPEEFAPK